MSLKESEIQDIKKNLFKNARYKIEVYVEDVTSLREIMWEILIDKYGRASSDSRKLGYHRPNADVAGFRWRCDSSYFALFGPVTKMKRMNQVVERAKSKYSESRNDKPRIHGYMNSGFSASPVILE